MILFLASENFSLYLKHWLKFESSKSLDFFRTYELFKLISDGRNEFYVMFHPKIEILVTTHTGVIIYREVQVKNRGRVGGSTTPTPGPYFPQ